GRAFTKMQAIIEAQGAKPFDPEKPALAPLSFDVHASVSGVVTGIDNLQMARIARLAGAPKVQGAGVDLLHKMGDAVQAGEPMYRVYAAYPADLEFARQAAMKSSGFTFGRADEVPSLFVEF
ncbi:MAG TPA: thymidine phosphorylase, partial [Aquabacterium sp.]|nr:thymidine phosphorylase [Aquabacterium sp.]